MVIISRLPMSPGSLKCTRCSRMGRGDVTVTVGAEGRPAAPVASGPLAAPARQGTRAPARRAGAPDQRRRPAGRGSGRVRPGGSGPTSVEGADRLPRRRLHDAARRQHRQRRAPVHPGRACTPRRATCSGSCPATRCLRAAAGARRPVRRRARPPDDVRRRRSSLFTAGQRRVRARRRPPLGWSSPGSCRAWRGGHHQPAGQRPHPAAVPRARSGARPFGLLGATDRHLHRDRPAARRGCSSSCSATDDGWRCGLLRQRAGRPGRDAARAGGCFPTATPGRDAGDEPRPGRRRAARRRRRALLLPLVQEQRGRAPPSGCCSRPAWPCSPASCAWERRYARRGREPLVDLSLFRRASYAFGT